MGSLILCHNKKAKHPYEIIRLHKKIYTIEELCYYLCNHLFLVDYTLMNHSLCSWIERELKMRELSLSLRDILAKNGSTEEFILEILEASKIYTGAEIQHIIKVLEKLKDHNDIEREKFKADTLFNNQEYDSAILIYRAIITGEVDDSVGKLFYGKIYANLGSCYGRQFLYEEAAGAYEKAYSIMKEPSILRAYLYSCYMAYPEADYVKMLAKNAEFLSMDRRMKDKMREDKKKVNAKGIEKEFNNWKKQYRKFDKR